MVIIRKEILILVKQVVILAAAKNEIFETTPLFPDIMLSGLKHIEGILSGKLSTSGCHGKSPCCIFVDILLVPYSIPSPPGV